MSQMSQGKECYFSEKIEKKKNIGKFKKIY
jgi:hypothetical protein